MHVKLRPSLPIFSLCLAAALAAAPGTAGELPPAALLERDGGSWAVLPSGVETELPFAASTLVAVEGGWLAAGTRPAEDGREIALATLGDGAIRELAPPARLPGAYRREPLPLASADGAVAGVAWLEGRGEDRLAVHFAPRQDAGWGPIEEVSPPGPGSQLALVGVVLADGSELLLWAAFDGGDDEILWSRRLADGWSPPARVAADNRVPDITPAVSPLAGGGALAAWSVYREGEYRVVVARFAGGAWSTPRPAGPPGSLFPTFEPAEPAAALLLLRTARPRGWQAVEVSFDGRPLRSAAVADPRPVRPRLVDEGAELCFLWPEGGGRRPAELSASWEVRP